MTARVLVVDDLVPNVKLLEAKLTSEYFEVVTAFDGLSALQVAETTNPDLILLDLMMPGMDGYEVCQKIKQNPRIRHIPVVMVTALSDTADRVRGLEAGADDFLTKPVNDLALFARVRSLVRLKMLLDEWRLREKTSGQFGMFDDEARDEAEALGDARILLVADRATEVERLRRMLSPVAAEVLVADAVSQAYEVAKTSDLDLIVVDLQLKGQDALRLCSLLRSAEETRHTPILLIVEEDDTRRLAKGMDLGVNDYIVRPLDRNELLARTRTQVRRRRYQNRIRDSYERSLELALTDPLTGLYNRRYLEAHIAGQLDRSGSSGKPTSVVIFDIDHFKLVNDTHGHAVGDAVLQELAARVNRNLRSFDTVARYGGEEFVVVMPDTELTVAAVVAERLRGFIADEPFKAEGLSLPVTVSIGVTASHGGTDSVATMLKRADDALYEAKRTGRNRVIVWMDSTLCGVDAALLGGLSKAGD